MSRSRGGRRYGDIGDINASYYGADADLFVVQVLLEQTEELLQKWKHPDPYKPPTAPGGSKYERNLPCPNLDREF